MTSFSDSSHRKKVAIVGSGCAGIAALWALNRTYHDVYLYEASDRLGGHTNTVQWTNGKFSAAVDTGFNLLNTAAYPNFLSFLKKIDVETQATSAAFSVSKDQGLFEWATGSLNGLFSYRTSLLRPSMWRMLFDVLRFKHFAVDLLLERQHDVNDEETIGQYLIREGYSAAFRDDYLIPLIGSFWTARADGSLLNLPAAVLVRHLWRHGLLATFSAQPEWLILSKGSQSYIDTVMRGFPPNHVFLKSPVRQVTNDENGCVALKLESGKIEHFDHVILATHGEQALSMLGPSVTAAERGVLSCFKTAQSEAILHSDTTFMPTSRRAWSSLNYSSISSSMSQVHAGKSSLTYNMNKLQHIPQSPFGDVLLTLNPVNRPRSALIRGRYFYSHPIITSSTVTAQNQLKSIQNTRSISYAGAWTGNGYHEDGFTSGLLVAKEHLGAKLPFAFHDPRSRRKEVPRYDVLDHLLRLIILTLQIFVIQVLERLARGARPSLRASVNGLKSKRLNGKTA